ncbi:acyltransferase family protein [Streptomyces albireticuli]|uniref:Acyltransferase n=1 Tax=Streptomyces albireticuli TaxID=1940 RepID=A0A2A2D6Q4_9ACTN|nr:acyltransferase [Streptomyces albireticuli]MCD9143028.1 acyltransferase [Streptomyces albireticuli]MCD9165271.1 acyltransferase [Streptomyces albireticuli]MCD9192211.1 acyltransferase [Streptomyces albireticuli]PAU47191.1 acyltransferase [Streptomyces albireticuli]
MRFAGRGELEGGRAAAVQRSAPRLYVLDGLRIIAALMVVMFHYVSLRGGWGQDTSDIFPELKPFARYGWLGVEVFFLISGFVICMSTWGRTLGDFVMSRVSRVYPAYWVAIGLTTLIVSLWPQVRQVHSYDDVLTNLTMLQTGFGVWDVDGVYWTLFVELKFYVLFAAVVATGVTYRKCVLFCALWTVVAMTATQVDSKLLTMWAMPLYAPYFVAGIAFYLMYRYRPTALLWGIAGLSLLLAQHHLTKRVADNSTHDIAVWPARLIVLAAFVIMALIAVGACNRIQWRWLSTAGALTYPLYLLHQYIGMTVIYALREKLPPYVLVFGLIVAMMGAAWLLHRLVERPMGSWLRKVMRSSMDEMRRHSPAGAARSADKVVPAPDTAVAPQRLRAYGPAEPDRVGAGRPDGS